MPGCMYSLGVTLWAHLKGRERHKHWKKNTRSREALTELGKEWDLSPELTDKSEKLTCRLYSSNTVTTNVNELRYQLFCSRRGEIESHQLPPCRDCLVKHTRWENYQVAIWKRCLKKDPEAPTPVGRGWKIEHEDGVAKLVVNWMERKSRRASLPNVSVS